MIDAVRQLVGVIDVLGPNLRNELVVLLVELDDVDDLEGAVFCFLYLERLHDLCTPRSLVVHEKSKAVRETHTTFDFDEPEDQGALGFCP